MEAIASVLLHTAVVSEVGLLEISESTASSALCKLNDVCNQANECPNDNQEDDIGAVEDDILRIVAKLIEVNVEASVCKVCLVIN